MSHTDIHKAFAESVALQLTDKEKKSLSEALYRLAEDEGEDVHGAILKTNTGGLTYEEITQLCVKIFGDRYPHRQPAEHRMIRRWTAPVELTPVINFDPEPGAGATLAIDLHAPPHEGKPDSTKAVDSIRETEDERVLKELEEQASKKEPS